MSEEKEKVKPHYYAIIPASVRYDKRLTPSARILYGEITALCNEKGYCWASNGYFMGLYEASKQTIINWLNALEKYGYIFIEMVLKENSKELDQRRIYISDPMLIENIKRANFTPPGQNNLTPPGKKNYTTRGKNNLTIPGKDILTHNNTSSFNTTFINISSIEEAKKYFSDKDYKSDPEMFWLKKGKRTKPKDRVDEADAWELTHRNMFPEKHKTTLNSANSDSAVAQSEPIKINNDDPLWLKLSEVLRSDFEKDVYEKWLSKLNFVDVKDGKMTLATESKFLRDWIKREHLKNLLSSFQQAEEGLKSINIIHDV